jgi:hypothetical protein
MELLMKSFREIREKKDACYSKVKSRYRVWPSAYASGALSKCRKVGADNWGNKSESQDVDLREDLRKWFKDKWVRFGPDGKIRGDCARDDASEGKPKCLPQSRAHAMGKKGRAQAAARKRRQDPDADRSGSAINVRTHKENFQDGRNPQDRGDSARHGLKGKSAAELRKIRSSDSASPRKKQLAHWLLNFHHRNH